MDARYTLKKNSDFRRLYAKGKSTVTPYLVLYCKKTCLSDSRVGFTVSAKLGNAVTRNRVRRQLREIVRLHRSELRSGHDLVLVARSRCVNSEYSKMDASFCKACAALNLFHEEGDRK